MDKDDFAGIKAQLAWDREHLADLKSGVVKVGDQTEGRILAWERRISESEILLESLNA